MTDEPPIFLSPPPPPPPPLPPPPPPLPSSAFEPAPSPVPETRPVIRWGMGDVLIGLVLWLIGGIAATMIVIATTGSSESIELADLGLGAIVVSLVAGWPGFLGWPMFATWFKGQRSLSRDFGLRVRPVDIGWGILGGVCGLAFSVIAGVLWGVLSDAPGPTNADFLPTRPSGLTAGLLLALVAVCTPVVEELFFRGLFLRSVGRRLGLPWAVVISSVAFGLLHFQGTGLHGLFISGVTATYGAAFALLVVRVGGRLGPAIIAHMVVNGVGVVSALYLV